MFCPACEQFKEKKCHWSSHQWKAYRVDVVVGGYERNCCKECSDEKGWYHNKKYENASAEEKQRIADVRAAEIARKEDAEAASAAMARAFFAAYAGTQASAAKATRAAEAERQREAREAELAEEWANAAKAEMDKRAAEARKAKAEKGGPPPPPPPPPSPKECTPWKPDLHEMKTQRKASITWIKKNVDESFWAKTHAHLSELNKKHRDELIELNESMGNSKGKSFKKILSWAGSIRLPADFPEALVTWTDETLEERHLEPGNQVYWNAFRAAWPMVLPEITNVESVGDLLEAFLAVAWMYRRNGVKVSDHGLDFVEILDRLVYAEYCLAYWHGGR